MRLKSFEMITGLGTRGIEGVGEAREVIPVQEGKRKHMASNEILRCQHYEPGNVFFCPLASVLTECTANKK